MNTVNREQAETQGCKENPPRSYTRRIELISNFQQRRIKPGSYELPKQQLGFDHSPQFYGECAEHAL